jgi:hypothetical protein
MIINNEIRGKHDWQSACAATLEFRTNGPQGGDRGWGGFLEVTVTNHGSTQIEVIVDGKKNELAQTVTLKFLGDDEMRMASEFFDFLAKKLKAVQQLCCEIDTERGTGCGVSI